MNEMRRQFLERIQSSIAKTGYHITVVAGGPMPRFAYSIGLSKKVGYEVVLAGASYFFIDEVKHIFDHVAVEALALSGACTQTMDCETNGVFELREAHSTWSGKMLLGALDYFDIPEVKTLQIVPDDNHWTIDVPDMTVPWGDDPIWQWLEREWDCPVPKDSHATTNLDALRGQPITEAVRWEDNEWEMFAGAGPDVLESDARTVPLGVLIGADNSLKVVTQLKIGKGLWRDDAAGDWHAW